MTDRILIKIKAVLLTSDKSSQVLNNSYRISKLMLNGQRQVIGNNANGISDVDPPQNLNDLSEPSKLLTVISKFDALTIFSLAKDGIEADVSTPTKIGLTRKQYYTRLMQLKNVGLIHKEGNRYYQTTMGSFLYQNCINSVIHAIKNSKQMTMIDVLKGKGIFTEEVEKIKTAFLTEPKINELSYER